MRSCAFCFKALSLINGKDKEVFASIERYGVLNMINFK
jgi:hypothetical protein